MLVARWWHLFQQPINTRFEREFHVLSDFGAVILQSWAIFSLTFGDSMLVKAMLEDPIGFVIDSHLLSIVFLAKFIFCHTKSSKGLSLSMHRLLRCYGLSLVAFRVKCHNVWCGILINHLQNICTNHFFFKFIIKHHFMIYC